MTTYFEDLEVADVGPVVQHTLTRTDLVRYAGASGDYNPMHHDEIKATKAGMPSTFGHGMLSMAIVGRALTDWFGADALRQFSVRFSKQTWPGNVLRTRVTVADKRTVEGQHLVDLTCELLNQDDEVVVAGKAIAAVPSRTSGDDHG
ncbi:MAG: acyl dehydratase [Glaciecola sp.]